MRRFELQGLSDSFDAHGFVVIERMISADRCAALEQQLPTLKGSGSRNLLSVADFRDTAGDLRRAPQLRGILQQLVPVQCIYFRKSVDHNWSIRLHRDDLLPIRGDGPWPPGGQKEGRRYCKPPREFLDRSVAVRLHLDGAPEGDLLVVPGSHRGTQHYSLTVARAIPVPKEGLLVIRPTIAHASTKLCLSSQRRVLHYVFAPVDVPGSYRWYDTDGHTVEHPPATAVGLESD